MATDGAPLVSILIPCWGCRQYIRQAMESALNQTYENCEVIVVEDCGRDGTYEEALKVQHPRLRVYRNERNYGQYGNKNQALKHARGPLIKYLDGDDILFPACVATLVKAWQEAGPGVGVVFARFVTIDVSGNRLALPRRWGLSGRCRGVAVLDWVTKWRSSGSMFGNVTPHLFHRTVLESIGGFPNDNAGPGDMETFLKLLCVTDVTFVEERVAGYRANPEGMAKRHMGLRECVDYIAMVEHLETFFKARPDLPAHLRDERFMRSWRVWASAHNIMALYQHKLRGKPSQFDAVKAAFVERGLGEEFDRFVRRRFLPYVLRALATKTRRAMHLPQHPNLFGRRFRREVAGRA